MTRMFEAQLELRQRVSALRHQVTADYEKADPIFRAEVDRIAGELQVRNEDTIEDLKAAFDNLCRRADALIRGGAAEAPYVPLIRLR